MAAFTPNTPQLKAAQEWVDAYGTRDIDKISETCSKNYTHQTLPKSMGLSEETKEEYIKRCGGLLPLFTKFEVTVHSMVEVPGKVVMHVTNLISTVYDAPLVYEAIFTISFVEEDGELKLSRCEDFVDSQEFVSFMNKVKAATEGGRTS